MLAETMTFIVQAVEEGFRRRPGSLRNCVWEKFPAVHIWSHGSAQQLSSAESEPWPMPLS